MNVASLELCKELYELSGWGNNPATGDSSEKVWHQTANLPPNDWICWERTHLADGNIPAYDLGYLLRKLPAYIPTHDEHADDYLLRICPNYTGDMWSADYFGLERLLYFQQADTPEDAACKLAIELWKQGILHD
jgi:hypothetical protein